MTNAKSPDEEDTLPENPEVAAKIAEEWERDLLLSTISERPTRDIRPRAGSRLDRSLRPTVILTRDVAGGAE